MFFKSSLALKCCFCNTEPNNKTTKDGLYVCCCYRLHYDVNNGNYIQHYNDGREPSITKSEEQK